MNPIKQVRANADKFAKSRAKVAMPTGGTQVTAENALQQRESQMARARLAGKKAGAAGAAKAAPGPQALAKLLQSLK